jgi:methionine biosynthesis protein MetW
MSAADADAVRAARVFTYENPRPEVQELVPATARRILDVGCSSGALGAALKARQDAEVVGLELDPVYAQGAAERLDRVVTGDVEQIAAREDLEADLGRFDCLICADVLEHLREPWAALERFAALLDPGGAAIVSLPNVRYWNTFWQLGRHGRWPRDPDGIFDSTHLRWFTGRDAHELLDGAGLELEEIRRRYRLKPGGTKWDERLQRLGRLGPLTPFLTFQYLLRARR